MLGGGGPQVGLVTGLDGVTRRALPQLRGVPHLHVNRPLVTRNFFS